MGLDSISGLTLKMTCMACPEQYDVYEGDRQVAYFRLRHGDFTVTVPGVEGVLIFLGKPYGDGRFDDDERIEYLTAAVNAVKMWLSLSEAQREKLIQGSTGFILSGLVEQAHETP